MAKRGVELKVKGVVSASEASRKNSSNDSKWAKAKTQATTPTQVQLHALKSEDYFATRLVVEDLAWVWVLAGLEFLRTVLALGVATFFAA